MNIFPDGCGSFQLLAADHVRRGRAKEWQALSLGSGELSGL